MVTHSLTPLRLHSDSHMHSSRTSVISVLTLHRRRISNDQASIAFIVPSHMKVDCGIIAHGQRRAHGVPIPLRCAHIITSRWYSSPDCAPAAILGQLTATHEIGLGA